MPDFERTDNMPLENDDDVKAYLLRQQARGEANKEALAAVQIQTAELATQVGALADQSKAHDRGQIEILRQMKEDRVELKNNTEITSQVRDFLTAKKIGTSVLIWLGSICGGVAGIVSLVFAFKK